MFDGFVLEPLDTGEVTLRVRHGGEGPPLLLLHGHPHTHVCWHRIAPRLAQGFFVVCPDLRGYGESSWAFMAQPAPLAQTFLTANPDAYYFREKRKRFYPEALADYLRAVHNPETIHAGCKGYRCEDYRANATCDRAADDADVQAGRRIDCPLLVLWAKEDDLEDLYGDPLAVWRDWADDVRGRGLNCGHYLAEEAPDEVFAELRAFFSGGV